MPRVLRRLRLVSLALVALMLLAACGGTPADEAAPAPAQESQAPAESTEEAAPAVTAAGLRVSLNNLLREHVFLAATATQNALGGDTAGFEAAGAAIQGNTEDLAALVGSVYGADTQAAFNELWASHITMFVDYTNGIAAGDQAAADGAVQRLTEYSQTLADTFQELTELPATASQPLILTHVTTLKTVVDKQRAGDLAGAYTDLRTAMGHMDQIASPLANAIATQQGIAGTVDSQAANLQVGLNGLLQEHVFLAGAATGAALGGNTSAFEAAAGAIGQNTTDLSAAVGSIYGPDIQSAFNELWASHIGMVVDYTTGIATDNTAQANDAVTRLTNYVGTLAATFEQVTTLPASASRGLIQDHVLTLKAAIDAQRAGDLPSAYSLLREAAAHMREIADPLASTIATQQNLT